MLKTALCRRLGIKYPIFSVGMGPAAGPELVAAVANADACGVLGAAGMPPLTIRERIQRVRALTGRPFGVNIILALLQEGRGRRRRGRNHCPGHRGRRSREEHHFAFNLSACRSGGRETRAGHRRRRDRKWERHGGGA